MADIETSFQRALRIADETKARKRAAWHMRPFRLPAPDEPEPGDDLLDVITLGGTRGIIVQQEDGEWPPFAIVQASRMVRRDPHYVDEAVELMRALHIFRPEIYPARPGFKYCASCGDWVRVEGFSPDASRRDGLHAYCKDCRNRQRREHYAGGREVRKYYRKQAA